MKCVLDGLLVFLDHLMCPTVLDKEELCFHFYAEHLNILQTVFTLYLVFVRYFYLYSNYWMCVRLGDCLSGSFSVSNNVRQWGILSPRLFNLYLDDLNRNLGMCNTVCRFNGLAINHIMHTDNLVVFAPPASGLMVNGQWFQLFVVTLS